MRKSRRRGGKRAHASLAYAVAVVSSFILSGVSPLAVVGALESTDNLNREDIHAPRILQHDYESSWFDTDNLRSKNKYLRLKGQSDLSLSQRRDDRQLVANKGKKTKTLRTAQKKVKMKTASDSVKHPSNGAVNTMVTRTSGQTVRTKVKNPLKEQMVRERLEKRTQKQKKRVNQGDTAKHTPAAETFLGNLELKWHQQVGGGGGKSDRYDRRSGKPSGGWNNNRWSGGRKPGGSISDRKPAGWRTDGWESDRWKPIGGKPTDRWSGGNQPGKPTDRHSEWWSGGGERSGNNNWADPCPCNYIDPVEGSGSSWSWSGSSWSWSGQMKVCTCEPTYKPTFYPTYYPT